MAPLHLTQHENKRYHKLSYLSIAKQGDTAIDLVVSVWPFVCSCSPVWTLWPSTLIFGLGVGFAECSYQHRRVISARCFSVCRVIVRMWSICFFEFVNIKGTTEALQKGLRERGARDPPCRASLQCIWMAIFLAPLVKLFHCHTFVTLLVNEIFLFGKFYCLIVKFPKFSPELQKVLSGHDQLQ